MKEYDDPDDYDEYENYDRQIRVDPELPSKFPLARNVIGEARKFIDEFMLNINGEGIFKSMGVNPNKTFVIDGPPGVGKTYAIKAINNQMNIKIYQNMEEIAKQRRNPDPNPKKMGVEKFKLFCFSYDIGKYGTAYINMGSRRIQQFFDEIKIYAKHGLNTLVVCDEADSLFGKRGNLNSHGEDHKVIETLMKNMQIAHDTDKMYLILMSNMPEGIDEASMRAGRIDKRYTFSLPKIEERKKAFKHAISQRNKQAGYCVIKGDNPEILAEMSDGFNYADIYQSVEEAIRKRAKEIIKKKIDKLVTIGYIQQSRLEKSVLNHKNQFRTDKYKIGFK